MTPACHQTLQSLVSCVQQRVRDAGDNVVLNDKFGFVPHVTLAKVSRPVARMRRTKYINSSYYDKLSSVSLLPAPDMMASTKLLLNSNSRPIIIMHQASYKTVISLQIFN